MLQRATTQKTKPSTAGRRRPGRRSPAEQAQAEREAYQQAKEHGLRSMRDVILARMGK